MRSWIFAALASAGCGPASKRAEPDPDARTVLASRLTHGMGSTPLESRLAADSVNAALLVALRRPMDSNGLASHLDQVPDGWHRVDTLRAEALVVRDSSGFHTSFPVVTGGDRVWYDSVTRAVAGKALRLHEAGFLAVLREVANRGWQEWQYHFVWSQVLDGQHLWARVVEEGLTPPLVPAVTWVIHPEHPYKSGTNLYPPRLAPPAYLAATWTPGVMNHLPVVESHAETLLALVRGEKVTDSARAALRAAGLVSDSMVPTVPVLLPYDSLLARVRSLSMAYVETLRREVDAGLLGRRLRCSAGLAWAAAYHDVSWSVVQSLVERGLMKRFGPPPGGAAGRVPAGSTALVPVDPAFTRTLEAAAAAAK